MADMNFGVNLLPVSNKSNSLGSSSKKWNNIYVNKINGQSPMNDSFQAMQSGIAIIVNGNTATTTIAEGQYVYIKGSTVLAEGLYRAITAVPSGTMITAQTAAAYFTAVSGGGLNDLNSKNAKSAVAVAFVNNVSADLEGRTKCYKHGDSVILNYAIECLNQASGYTTVMNIPIGYSPSNYIYGTSNTMKDLNSGTSVLVIGSNGEVQLKLNGVRGTFYTGSISWTI